MGQGPEGKLADDGPMLCQHVGVVFGPLIYSYEIIGFWLFIPFLKCYVLVFLIYRCN